ncbi:hypothetical protein Aph02nite_05730 [Actinoplanes philippinensis]|uniref:Uncharacterized protein n=1 Tax=Actinoplanes philippinensis TaxID=35752 RepID=A0A1I2CX19_9ACTN|nr:hypothetical protein [Actinoplanes philippinensis]GIE74623.1 hypothetical protein Aph02nite_05730 [Actinoplanes philippinensis]SFE72836.1 hypothetical protein SAMN05421541_103259 [Actinoplanes philippinensis]
MNPIGEPLEESVHHAGAQRAHRRDDADPGQDRSDDPADVTWPGPAARPRPAGEDRGAAPLG